MWPSVDLIEGIDGEQPVELAKALAGPIGLFGGSPGTGKTYTVSAAVRTILQQFGAGSTCVCAPTGKAAVRLTEALNTNRVPLRAKTIHSTLGVEPSQDGFNFKYREGRPLPFRFVIVDESSMVDTNLATSLFSAVGRGTRVLLVGDINQLPPVGHGAPLRDLIAAGLPYGELREIRRNDGLIVRTCANIRDGLRLKLSRQLDLDNKQNLALRHASEPKQQIAAVLEGIKQANAAGLDPIWDVQILAAVNAKSPLSRKELNKVLQLELNRRHENKHSVFWPHDKIVCTENGFYKVAETDPGEAEVNEDGKVWVANGELAKVILVDAHLMIASLTAPNRVIRIPLSRPQKRAEVADDEDEEKKETGTGCKWDLGFALSCHKSQGSAWPVVLVMLDKYAGARMVCSREWLYTAISRAELWCELIGEESTAAGMCHRLALPNRKTFLKEQLWELSKPLWKAADAKILETLW